MSQEIDSNEVHAQENTTIMTTVNLISTIHVDKIFVTLKNKEIHRFLLRTFVLVDIVYNDK
jgi:hypothetical protein